MKGWPFAEKLENYMALFNEFMLSVYLYVSMALTGFNTNPFYNSTGTALMGVVITSAGVNLLKFLFSVIKATAL